MRDDVVQNKPFIKAYPDMDAVLCGVGENGDNTTDVADQIRSVQDALHLCSILVDSLQAPDTELITLKGHLESFNELLADLVNPGTILLFATDPSALVNKLINLIKIVFTMQTIILELKPTEKNGNDLKKIETVLLLIPRVLINLEQDPANFLKLPDNENCSSVANMTLGAILGTVVGARVTEDGPKQVTIKDKLSEVIGPTITCVSYLGCHLTLMLHDPAFIQLKGGLENARAQIQHSLGLGDIENSRFHPIILYAYLQHLVTLYKSAGVHLPQEDRTNLLAHIKMVRMKANLAVESYKPDEPTGYWGYLPDLKGTLNQKGYEMFEALRGHIDTWFTTLEPELQKAFTKEEYLKVTGANLNGNYDTETIDDGFEKVTKGEGNDVSEFCNDTVGQKQNKAKEPKNFSEVLEKYDSYFWEKDGSSTSLSPESLQKDIQPYLDDRTHAHGLTLLGVYRPIQELRSELLDEFDRIMATSIPNYKTLIGLSDTKLTQARENHSTVITDTVLKLVKARHTLEDQKYPRVRDCAQFLGTVQSVLPKVSNTYFGLAFSLGTYLAEAWNKIREFCGFEVKRSESTCRLALYSASQNFEKGLADVCEERLRQKGRLC